MENDEEFFIVRFTGPQPDRDAVFDYLTGKSMDFANYSRFFDAMDVKRVQSLKDFFSAMNPIQLPKISEKSIIQAEKPKPKPMPKPRSAPSTSSGHQKTSKPLNTPQKREIVEEKPSDLLLTSSGPQKPSNHHPNSHATSSGHPTTSKPSNLPQKREIVEEKPSDLHLTSSGPQKPSNQLPVLTIKILRTHRKPMKRQSVPVVNEFPKIPKIEEDPKIEVEKKSPVALKSQWPNRNSVVTSQTLKLHNICFEKKKTNL